MKLRGKLKLLKTGTIIKAWHCIEVQQGRTWSLLGDEDNGVFKFSTAEERDAKLTSLREMLHAN